MKTLRLSIGHNKIYKFILSLAILLLIGIAICVVAVIIVCVPICCGGKRLRSMRIGFRRFDCFIVNTVFIIVIMILIIAILIV